MLSNVVQKFNITSILFFFSLEWFGISHKELS